MLTRIIPQSCTSIPSCRN